MLAETLDVLAERPNVRTDSSTLARSPAGPRREIKGIWTHVGRHVGKKYPGLPWPLDAIWGPHIEPGTPPAVTFYRLNPDQAAAWRDARTDDAG